MSKYFDSAGYFKCADIFTDPQPFIFILGGRGIGKTYGVTKWLCEHASEDHKFIFMRRTENEIKFVNTGNIYSEHSPEVSLNSHGKFARVERKEKDDSTDIIGYHLALSTIHNIRGFSMLDVDYIVFDEFIAERGVVIRKFAGEQMLNAYETINRNRELKGAAAVKCIFLSNYNTSESDIMQAFGFTDEIYTYSQVDPIGIYQDDYKKLIMINRSPISEKKLTTALYNVTNNDDYKKMSIENDGNYYIMPIAHHGRNAYEYLGTLGSINVNRLYSGYYYLTESQVQKDITKKDLIHYLGVYKAYTLGNVYCSSQFIAQKFINLYE